MSPRLDTATSRYLLAFSLAGEVLLVIAVPTAIVAYGAYRLDYAFELFPLLSVSGLVLSLALVFFLLQRMSKRLKAFFHPDRPSV